VNWSYGTQSKRFGGVREQNEVGASHSKDSEELGSKMELGSKV